jgi:hypothetical protein
VSFAAITLCVASQRVFIVVAVVYFVMDSVQKVLDTPSRSVLTRCFMSFQLPSLYGNELVQVHVFVNDELERI